MSHPLWVLLGRLDLAIEMVRSPLSGDTADAVRAAAANNAGQVENTLNAAKADLQRFIQQDEAKAALASLPAPALPIAIPSTTSKKDTDHGDNGAIQLTQIQKLAERVLVSLLARSTPVPNPAVSAMEYAQGFFKMLEDADSEPRQRR